MNDVVAGGAPDAPPLLSVVLITRNGSSTIGEQLDAILGQVWDRRWELVVVDNGSTDETPMLVQRRAEAHPHVRLIEAADRPGAGHARNVGVEAAAGQYVAFVDDDDVVGEGWLHALGEAVIEDDYVAARLEVRRLNDSVALSTRNPAQQDRLDEFCGVPVSAAPLIAIRRDWVRDVGGFDPEIWPEDTDFAIRVFAEKGRGPVFCPEAVYHYRLRRDVRSVARQAFRYGRVRPLLLRRWRDVLDPPSDVVRGALTEWARLIATIPRTIADPGRRLSWVRRVSARVGHLVGSVRYRVIWP